MSLCVCLASSPSSDQWDIKTRRRKRRRAGRSGEKSNFTRLVHDVFHLDSYLDVRDNVRTFSFGLRLLLCWCGEFNVRRFKVKDHLRQRVPRFDFVNVPRAIRGSFTVNLAHLFGANERETTPQLIIIKTILKRWKTSAANTHKKADWGINF